MKVSVRIRGEWFAVPCGTGKQTISWLGAEALKKYAKLSSNEKDNNNKLVEEKFHEIRKTKGGAILDPCDIVSTVLDDNDFLTVGKLLFLVKSKWLLT